MAPMALPDRPVTIEFRAVDTRAARSLSFAPDPGARGSIESREPVPVGPGRAAPIPSVSFPFGGDRVHEFPIQSAKVQRPPLRRETLRRERLIDWLRVKIHSRVVLVTAEAGYGKTTLLADFARHSRRPTMWYRLDAEDRNWVSFIHYLVAAGREIQPGFGSATRDLLDELATSTGPTRDTIIATLMRDFQALGGGALVIDDYHLVDDVPDVRVVVRELLARAPERLSLVFIGRQPPTLPLSRLRTLGEVAELTASDLRFDLAETERLFRDTYARPLEPDVLAELDARTEGWAASLQLVHTALRDRSPGEVRAFVRGMSGAHGELHDYLAEEVVGDLDEETQQFLMRTSILQSVDPDLAAVVVGISEGRARELIDAVGRLGLLSRRGRGGERSRRYHPLVRDFLETRLRGVIGEGAVRDLHRDIARHAGQFDWRLAAHHYAAAADLDELMTVIEEAVPEIMGGGEFALAESYVQQTSATGNAPFELLRSRMELYRGSVEAALEHAEAAVDAAMRSNDDTLIDHALLNLIAALYAHGRIGSSRDVARALAARTSSAPLRDIATAVVALADGSLDANLDEIREQLIAMAGDQDRRGLIHFAGITWLNIADLDRARGDAQGSQEASTKAIEALSTSSASFEVETARINRAWASVLMGNWTDALIDIGAAERSELAAYRGEIFMELASLHALLGDRVTANAYLRKAEAADRPLGAISDYGHLISALLEIRAGDADSARAAIGNIQPQRPHASFGFNSLVHLVEAEIAIAANAGDASVRAAAAVHLSARQGARLYHAAARVLMNAIDGSAQFGRSVEEVSAEMPAALSLVAESIATRLGFLSSEQLLLVASEVRARPSRWREPLRRALTQGDVATQLACAQLLDEVGDIQDVVTLRRLARKLKAVTGAAGLGRGLSRHLAPRVYIEDQGRIQIRIGDQLITGSSVRRKVLALLCYLLTRPGMSATRDQTLEALWPDLEPDIAANSLNQTVYFLRRVFEPAFNEDTSPGYVHHDSDVLWLDPELVSSRSIQTRTKIKAARTDPSPDNVEALSDAYQGRFGLDFSYEEWAAPYRESMHAAYLEIIESAIQDDVHAGAFDRAITLAQRAVELDPDAEEIELSLLKLYRRTGAHAAAAEQYVHYAAVLQDLGIEPPALESL